MTGTRRRQARPRWRVIAAALASIVVVGGGLGAAASSANADTVTAPVVYDYTFQINDLRRAPDVNLGDGQCLTQYGTCTIDAAIQEANRLGVSALGGNDAKRFQIIPAPTMLQADGTQVTSGLMNIYLGRGGTTSTTNPTGMANALVNAGLPAATGAAIYDNDYQAMYDVRAQITMDLQNRIGFTSGTTYDWGNSPIVFLFRGKNTTLRNYSAISGPEGLIYVGATAQNTTIENGKLWTPTGIGSERGVVIVGGAQNTTIRGVNFDGMYCSAVSFLTGSAGAAASVTNGVKIDRSSFTNISTGANNYDAISSTTGCGGSTTGTVNNLSVTNSTFSDWKNTAASRAVDITTGTWNNMSMSGNTFSQSANVNVQAIHLGAGGTNNVIEQNSFVYKGTSTGSIGNGPSNAWIWNQYASGEATGLTIRDNKFSGGKNSAQIVTGSAANNTISVYRNTMSGVGGTATAATENASVATNNVQNSAANAQLRTAWPVSAVVPNQTPPACAINVLINAPATTGTTTPGYPYYVDAYIGRTTAAGGDNMGIEQYLGRVKISSAADEGQVYPFSYTGGGDNMVVRLQTLDSLGRTSQYSRTVVATGADNCPPQTWIKQGSAQEDPTSNRMISFDISSSEPLGSNDLTTGDIVFSGSAANQRVVSLTQISPTRWTLVTMADSTGTVIPSIPAGAVNDLSGNTSLKPSNSTTAPIDFAGATDDEQMIGIAGAALDHTVTYNSPLSITAPSPKALTVAEGGATQTYRVQITAFDPTTGVLKAPTDTLNFVPTWSGLVSDATLPTPPGATASSVATLGATNPSLNDSQPTLDTFQEYVDVPVTAIDNAIVDGTRGVTLATGVVSTDPEYDGLLLDTINVTATDNDKPVANSATFSVEPTSKLADGVSANTATATIKNAGGNLVQNAPVTFTLPAGVKANGVNGPGTVTVNTDANGVAALPITSSLAGTYSISASVNSPAEQIGTPQSITFLQVPIDPAKSSFSTSTGELPADGSSAHSATVTAKDANGNPLAGANVYFAVTGATGSGVVQTDANGVATIAITATVLGTKAVTAYTGTDSTGLVIGTGSVVFTYGAPSAGSSTLTVTSGDKTANGTDKHTASVLVKDANGNVVPNATVTFAIPAGVSTASTTATTNASGVASIDLTSTVAGTYSIGASVGGAAVTGSPKDIKFVAGPVAAASSTLTLSTGTRIADGVDAHTASVVTKDANGNVVPFVTVGFSVTGAAGSGTVVSDANGVATIQITSTTTGAKAVSATIAGASVPGAGNVNFGPGPVSASASKLTVTTGSVPADGVSSHTATVLVTDAQGHPVQGTTVAFAVAAGATASSPTAVSGFDGKAEITITSTTAKDYAVAATINSATVTGSPATVTFSVGAAVAANSSWSVSPNSDVVANGTSKYTATFTAKDATNNNVKDAVFTINVPGDVTASAQTCKTGADGTCTIDFTSTKAGTYPASAALVATPVGSDKSLTFIAGPVSVSNSALVVTQGLRTANGVDSHTATVTVTDVNGNPIQGTKVDFVVAGAAGTASVISDGNGVATTTITSTTVGSKAVSASIGGTAVKGSPTSVSFQNDVASSVKSTMVVTSGPALANDSDTQTATVTVRDSNGNPVQGATVDFTVAGGASFVGGTAGAVSVVSGPNGVAVAQIKSATPGSFDVHATLGGVDVTGSPAPAVFSTGPVDAIASTFSVTTGNKTANGVDTHTLTATIKDAQGHPLSGKTVNFTAASGANLTSASAVTNTDGVATTTVATVVAGTYAVSASISGATLTGAPANVTFVSGPASASSSAFTVSAGTVLSNGVAAHSASVKVVDAQGNPVSGQVVEFQVPNGVTPSASSAVSGPDGIATIQLTSTNAATYSIGATIGGATVTGAPKDITFSADAPSAEKSSWVVTPAGPVAADGTAAYTATVTTRDANGNLASGTTVTFTAANGVTPSALSCTTSGVAATCSVTFTAVVSGNYIVTAGIGADQIGSAQTLAFVAGPASASNSTIVATPSSVKADGTSASAITVQLVDAKGNPLAVAGGNVIISSTLGVISEMKDNGNGTYSAKLTSSSEGTATVSYTINGTKASATASVAFTDATPPTAPIVSPSNGSTVSGQAEPGSTVTLTDKNGAVIGSGLVGENGTFSIVPSPRPADGATVTVKATDTAGNVSPGTTITVDAVAPVAPVVKPTNGSTVTGTAEPGSTVTVEDAAGNVIGSAIAGLDGSYSITPSPKPADLDQLKVTATDIAGNVSLPTPVTVDASAPTAPVVNPSNGSAVTGLAEPGSTVTVKDKNGTVIGTGVAGTDGTFSVTPSPKPADGDAVSVSATDPAGNVSPSTSITIDRDAPSAPAVNPSNGSSVTGTAEPGSAVTVKDPAGNVIGSGVAGTDGSYSITPSPKPSDGQKISVSATDPAGNVSPPTSVTIDAIAPTAPIVDPSNGSIVTGSAEPGSTVTVKDPAGNVIGSGVAGTDGSYSITPSPRPSDREQISVTATDPAGNTSPTTVVSVDATAPTAPVLFPSNGSVVSGTAEPGSTVTVKDADGTVIGSAVAGPDGKVSITLNPVATTGDVLTATAMDLAGNESDPVIVEVNSGIPTSPVVNPSNGSVVSGTTDPGATVTVKDKDGNVVGTGTAGPDGSFSIVPSPTPVDGEKISVTSTNNAGTDSAPSVITIDAIAPNAPSVDQSNGSVVSGTAEPGSTVTVKDKDGNVIGSEIAGPDGAFSIIPNPTPGDGKEISVTATDPAGNTSPTTEVTIDAIAPTAPAVDPSNGSVITGTGEPGSTVTVTDPAGTVIGTGTVDPEGNFSVTPSPTPQDGEKIGVTVTDPAGNTSPKTEVTIDAAAPTAPVVDPSNGSTVKGSAEPGSTVTVEDKDGNVIGTGTAGPDGSYSITPSPKPGDGEELTVTATDPSGNTSPGAPVTIDATAPTAPEVDPSNGSTVTGTAEPGSTVTVEDKDGNVIGTVVTGPDGTFSITPSPKPGDGETIVITSTDPAGNTSPATEVKVDATAPTAPVVDPTNGSPITGTGEPGSTVTVKDKDGNVIGTGEVDDKGDFSVVPNPVPGDGETVVVTVTDPSGNTSPATEVKVDATAPTAPVVDPTNGSPITGTGEPGSTVTVKDKDGNVIGTGEVDDKGDFSVVPNPVPGDGETIVVTVTDPSGNTSPATEVKVDATAPAVPVLFPSNGTVVSGTAEPGSTVTVKNAAGTVIGSAVAGPDGKVSITLSPAATTGDVLTGTATDAAGNESDPVTIEVNSGIPTSPVVNPSNGTVVTGTTDPGATVTVKDKDGNVIGTGTAGPDGTFSIVPSPKPVNGAEISVISTNNAGTDSAPSKITIDASAPTAPTVDPSNGSVVEGTAEPGSTVTVKDKDGNVIGSGTAGPDGSYSIVPSPKPGNGETITVTTTDPAGNTSPGTTVTIDAIAPVAPVVNPSNGSTISGQAEPGSTVTVKDKDGNVIGSVVAGPDGTFTIVPNPKPGDGDVVTVTATDPAGNASVSVSVTIDASAPSAPVLDPTDGKIVTGHGEPGTVVTITTEDGKVLGTGTVGEDGRFSITIPQQEPGAKLIVTVTDAAGNTSEPTVVRVDEIVVPEEPYEVPPVVEAPSDLASTGAPVYVPLLLGASLIGLGLALFASRRRNDREEGQA